MSFKYVHIDLANSVSFVFGRQAQTIFFFNKNDVWEHADVLLTNNTKIFNAEK